ncbi:MAG TPA: hypothetical protein VGZ22_03725 [Isosphaeraceae bacterium]|nr:hypothetical protein [Isosphaeraceae bacterium]
MKDNRRFNLKRVPALELLDRRDVPTTVVPVPLPPSMLIGPFIPGQPLDIGSNIGPNSGVLHGSPFQVGSGSASTPTPVPAPLPPSVLVGPFVPGQPIELGNNIGPNSGVLHSLPFGSGGSSVPTTISNAELSKLISLFMPKPLVHSHAVHHQFHSQHAHH